MPGGKKRAEDKHVRLIQEKLEQAYRSQHPRAQVEAKRYNSVSVRVRIIDPDFAGHPMAARDDAVWAVLDSLPDDTRAEISLLLLLTPEEAKTSLMNLEFEDPTPSRL
jgi:hypothetical protein